MVWGPSFPARPARCSAIRSSRSHCPAACRSHTSIGRAAATARDTATYCSIQAHRLASWLLHLLRGREPTDVQMASEHCGTRASQRTLHTSFVSSQERILSGFVVDLVDQAERFVVELLIDGLSVKTRRADEYVFELAQQNIGDGCYGFSFFLRDEFVSEGLVAEARLANVGTLIGSPIIFGTPDQSTNSSPPGEVRWLGGLRFSGW